MVAIQIFAPHGVSMSIEFSPAVIDACSAFVITLDRHPLGAAALVAVLLAGGTAVALAKWRRK
ncbi:hypothetical protein CSQ96_08720 [Janthinobacterium sp. BJB412]|nr:hypothetical protein CSQ96_08720 [Janthinobacterium sp. BJB412]